MSECYCHPFAEFVHTKNTNLLEKIIPIHLAVVHIFPKGSEFFFSSSSFTLRKWHPEHVLYFVMTFLFLLLPNPPLQYKSTQFYSLYIFFNLSVSTLSSSRICLPWHFHLNTLTHLSSHAGSPTSSFPYQSVYISPLPEMTSPSESKETGNHLGSDRVLLSLLQVTSDRQLS